MTSAASEQDTGDQAEWRAISSGAQSNIEEATQTVIRDPQAWAEWWQSHNTTVEVIDGEESAPAPPEVDFSEETVLVATMGTRNTGGYSIAFTGIRRDGETLVATYKTESPDPDGFVTMALTAPYAIIAVPRHEGPVEFAKEEG